LANGAPGGSAVSAPQRNHSIGIDRGRLARGTDRPCCGTGASHVVCISATLFVLGLWVLGTTATHAYLGTLPHAEVMGIVGVLALLTNAGVAAMLYRFRGGDANVDMRAQ